LVKEGTAGAHVEKPEEPRPNTSVGRCFGTATGNNALYSNTTGNKNTAVGVGAIPYNTTGSNNIAIGYYAADSIADGSSNNIHIGNPGFSTDNGTIRIGSAMGICLPFQGCGHRRIVGMESGCSRRATRSN
jgi:hypothetical protein